MKAQSRQSEILAPSGAGSIPGLATDDQPLLADDDVESGKRAESSLNNGNLGYALKAIRH